MKSLRVAVLVHSSLIPPEKVETKELESVPWRTEHYVSHTLAKMGHDIKIVGVDSDLKVIRTAIEEFKPNVIFNLLEEFDGEAIFDQNVVSYLEMLKVKYTGNSPIGLIIARNKALAKKIMKYHDIPTPKFHVFKRYRKPKLPDDLSFPLFVKTLNEEASLGISKDSLVKDEERLLERVKFLQEKYETDVLVEEYIAGRELYVSILGNEQLNIFYPVELEFNQWPEGEPKIATAKVKWDDSYRKKYGIKLIKAKGLKEEQIEEIKSIGKQTYKALELNGYARIDFRMSNDGKFYVIEANPNPDIAKPDEFANAARLEGLNYEELLNKILSLGMRWSST